MYNKQKTMWIQADLYESTKYNGGESHAQVGCVTKFLSKIGGLTIIFHIYYFFQQMYNVQELNIERKYSLFLTFNCNKKRNSFCLNKSKFKKWLKTAFIWISVHSFGFMPYRGHHLIILRFFVYKWNMIYFDSRQKLWKEGSWNC